MLRFSLLIISSLLYLAPCSAIAWNPGKYFGLQSHAGIKAASAPVRPFGPDNNPFPVLAQQTIVPPSGTQGDYWFLNEAGQCTDYYTSASGGSYTLTTVSCVNWPCPITLNIGGAVSDRCVSSGLSEAGSYNGAQLQVCSTGNGIMFVEFYTQ